MGARRRDSHPQYYIVVHVSACHAEEQGSIPGDSDVSIAGVRPLFVQLGHRVEVRRNRPYLSDTEALIWCH